MTVELTIERIGTDGLGLARYGGRLLALPYTLPGERVLVEPGPPPRVVQRLSDSPERAAPPCRHFGACGGCLLQHLSADAYAAFKSRLALDALGRHGLTEIAAERVRISPPGSRRRATLALQRRGRRTLAGFHALRSKDVVDIDECTVMVRPLVALIGPLRALATELPISACALEASETGVDAGITLPAAPDLGALERLARFAAEQDLARLWWRRAGGPATPVVERRRPQASMAGGIRVDLPPGAFRQATAAGETAMVAAAAEAVAGAARIADLFAGIGTFALALAAGRAVHAIEQDEAALSALVGAARRFGLRGVTTERRDLERRPLAAAELARFDAVILDPPRAGARAQATALAASAVPTVVAVSCDPSTFARDAAILRGGGYRLERLLPIDQFLWSPHLELVATFRRG